ncbi:general substrate transporter [Dactylonectria estremocensis]|uniref:General substrate transporter n=1 Tax=Dactylonectria estremocensis TaxID=1079267 RepID=A0A9P9III1_9HYPO|nr:general substrate transporter [Dactylonectria estremocensis]
MSKTITSFWFTVRHNPRLMVSAFFLSMVFFTFGYDGGVISGLLAMAPFNADFGSGHGAEGVKMLTSTDISLIVALPNSGCLLGLPLAAILGDRIGRKKTLLIGCAFNALGAAIQTGAPNLATMVVGRWFTNASIFMFITMGSNLLAEISPSEIRGILTGLSIVLIDAAAILSQGLNYAFSNVMHKYSYQVPLGVQIFFAVFICAGVLTLDDSATFYLTKGQDERALKALRTVRGGYDDAAIAAEFASLKAQSQLRQEEDPVSFKDLFTGVNRRRTLIALSIANMQQLSGIAFATNYITLFLSTIGGNVSAFTLAMAAAILAFGGAIVGLCLVDIVGRRFLALTSFSIIAVINLVVGVMGFLSLENPAVSSTIAAFCCMFAFFYAAGFGPLTYIIAAEVPSARLRNKSNSVTFFAVACFATVVTYVLPYLSNADAANLGPKIYLIFFGWMVGCIIVTYFYLPETKGRTPAELDEMFEARLPARKFKGYVCALAVENFTAEAKLDGPSVEVEEDLETKA